MTTTKVAVISGSNKGVGFGVVRALCKQFDGDVYLTARNEALGKAAVQELEKEDLHPKFHQLDIIDEASVMTLAKFLKNQYNGIDILVNNAGTVPYAEQAEQTQKTNYWGTLTVCKHLLPLMKPHGRVVHVSSRQSHIALHKCSAELRNKLLSLKTIDQVNEYMTTFVNLAKEGNHIDHGWPDVTAYCISKIGVTLLAPIQQQLIDQESDTRTDIIINACCPGGVATDMTNHQGPLTIDQGSVNTILPVGTKRPNKFNEFVGLDDCIQVNGAAKVTAKANAILSYGFKFGVSGSNKGIGFAIVRALCKQFNGDVYMTARNEALGKAAVQELEKEGLHPKFHQLDITDEASVMTLAKFLKNQYNGIDILINNAGIAFKNDATDPFSVQAEVTVKTNYWGTLTACKHLLPLIKSHGRVVHVSSRVTHMALGKCSEELKKKLLSLKTIDEVNEYMTTFVKLAKEGKHTEHGWPSSAYGVSKIGVSLITPIQQQLIDQDTTRSDIIINCCCPGYVDTDMSSHKGHLTIDQGADTPVYLSLLPPSATEPRGQFVAERKVFSLEEKYSFT